MLRDHVNVYNVSLNVQELVIEDGLDKRIRVFAQIGIGGLGNHEGRQRPYCVWSRKSLGQASEVLSCAIERSSHTIHPLERLCQPCFNARVENYGWRSTGRECLCGCGQQSQRHNDVGLWAPARPGGSGLGRRDTSLGVKK